MKHLWRYKGLCDGVDMWFWEDGQQQKSMNLINLAILWNLNTNGYFQLLTQQSNPSSPEGFEFGRLTVLKFILDEDCGALDIFTH